MIQGSDEWFAARLGKVTASQLANVLMKPATSGYQNYASQLVCERLTGKPTVTFKSAAMEHGNETEPQARAMYELVSGNHVEEVGFIDHPVIAWTGASPDGLIGGLGCVEIKCPQPTKHIKNLMGGKIDRGYMLQMQWQMICAEREWCDFISFSPEFPDHLQLHIQRVAVDDEMIAEITTAVSGFLGYVDEIYNKLAEEAA